MRYELSVRCARTRRVLTDLATADVSASGLRLRSDDPHGFAAGDRLEVQVFARVRGHEIDDTLVLATDAVVVRADGHEAALRFDGPLTY